MKKKRYSVSRKRFIGRKQISLEVYPDVLAKIDAAVEGNRLLRSRNEWFDWFVREHFANESNSDQTGNSAILAN